MYVLKYVGTDPALYVGVVNGFIEKVDTVNQAFQMFRQQDAAALKEIMVEDTVPTLLGT